MTNNIAVRVHWTPPPFLNLCRVNETYYFWKISYYFWMIMCMKKANNFGRFWFSLRVLLSICLIFCQSQPGVAYRSVAYKNKRVTDFMLIVQSRTINEKVHNTSWHEWIDCHLQSDGSHTILGKTFGTKPITQANLERTWTTYIWVV